MGLDMFEDNSLLDHFQNGLWNPGSTPITLDILTSLTPDATMVAAGIDLSGNDTKTGAK